jgi:hypothetical protein
MHLSLFFGTCFDSYETDSLTLVFVGNARKALSFFLLASTETKRVCRLRGTALAPHADADPYQDRRGEREEYAKR